MFPAKLSAILKQLGLLSHLTTNHYPEPPPNRCIK